MKYWFCGILWLVCLYGFSEEKVSWNKSARLNAPVETLKGDTLKLQQMSKTIHTDDLLIDILKAHRPIPKDTISFPPTPLATPLLYIPPQPLTLDDTIPSWTDYDSLSIRENTRRYLTTHCADLYDGVMDTIPQIAVDERRKEKVKRLSVEDFDIDALEAQKDVQLKKLRRNPDRWIKELNVYVQASQNYMTSNWHQGGNPNVTSLAGAVGKLDYHTDKFSWENRLDWKIGFSTVSEDTMRKINTSEDAFKFSSKAGYKVTKKWDVTTLFELSTPFVRTWRSNENTLTMAPFTPLKLNLSLGMDYKPVDGLSILISPVTYKMVHAAIRDERILVTDFGIDEGEKTLNDVGSSVRIEWIYKPHYMVEMTNIFNFFTNYKQVEIDWELTLNLQINHYFSARVSVHPRYDNTVIYEDGSKAKMQFKEVVSIGFSHTFRTTTR